MWWVLVPLIVIAYLWFGAFLAKKFFVSVADLSELDDPDDVIMMGLVTIIAPVVLPLVVVIYGFGKVVCKLPGSKMKRKKETTK